MRVGCVRTVGKGAVYREEFGLLAIVGCDETSGEVLSRGGTVKDGCIEAPGYQP